MARVVETREAYARWADSYDTSNNPLVAMVAAALPGCVGPFSGRAVELGCGTGRNLRALAALGARSLAGVDFSAEMLAVAAAELPRATLVEHDLGEASSLPGASADLVLVSLVLEHLEDPLPVLREAKRLLAPGGRLLAFELHPAAFDAGTRAGFRPPDGDELWMASFRHDSDELDRCAQQAGFGPGRLRELRPDGALTERFPKLARRSDLPWLLIGEWSAPEG